MQTLSTLYKRFQRHCHEQELKQYTQIRDYLMHLPMPKSKVFIIDTLSIYSSIIDANMHYYHGGLYSHLVLTPYENQLLIVPLSHQTNSVIISTIYEFNSAQTPVRLKLEKKTNQEADLFEKYVNNMPDRKVVISRNSSCLKAILYWF